MPASQPLVVAFDFIGTLYGDQHSGVVRGAADAAAAVRGSGGRAVVVVPSSTDPAMARYLLQGQNIIVDDVVADTTKASALRQVGADVFVGDAEVDMLAAVEAGALPVAIHRNAAQAELAPGKELVALGSIAQFGPWFRANVDSIPRSSSVEARSTQASTVEPSSPPVARRQGETGPRPHALG